MRAVPALAPGLAVALAAAACTDASPPAAVVAALAAHAEPSTWTDLDAAHPGTRLRDPRTGLVFRRIPAGEFVLGGNGPGEAAPAHRVRLSAPFLLAETEVTVGAWKRYTTGFAGDRTVPVPAGDDALPMPVSWDDASAFCARFGYRLPTEAQWVFACLGGEAPTAPAWRDEQAVRGAAWFNVNAGTGSHPVGGRAANGYGLRDTLGNLWEWCADWYAPDHAGAADPATDPTGPATGQGRLLCGGSWFSVNAPRPDSRTGDVPHERNAFYGFRPLRPLP